MALESFSGIWSLNTSNPTSSDDINQGDDHIRGIKASLRQTFPAVSATVNVSHSELNHLSGVASNIHNSMEAISKSLSAEISRGDLISASLAGVITRVSALSSSVAVLESINLGVYGGLTISAGASPIFSASPSLSSFTQWDAGAPTSNVTVVTANGSLSPDVTGIYSVHVQMSFSGGASTEYQARLFKDDVATNYGFKRALGTGADIGSASFNGLISANAGAVLKVRLATTSASDKDINPSLGSFLVHRIIGA